MNTTLGLLWYDNSKAPLAAKLAPAIARHRERLGTRPTVCFVNTAQANGELVNGLRIEPRGNVLPNHFWLEA